MKTLVSNLGFPAPGWAKFAFVWMAFAIPTCLLEAQNTATGAIRGILDHAATGNRLEGAEVAIPTLGLKTLTSRDGSFELSNIPPGSHTLRVFYTGTESQSTTVEVRANATAQVRVAVGEGPQQLEAFLVESTRHGE